MVMVIVILIVFGLCLGSFVNALVWRLHAQAEQPTRSKKQPKGSQPLAGGDLSILKGRSMCPDCHHELAAKDLVPVLSWLSLRGKCRYCRQPISPQYPVVELLTAILFIVSYLFWPSAVQGQGLFDLIVWLGFIVGFMALAIYDLKWYLLPNRIVYPLIGLGVAQVLIDAIVFGGGMTAVWSALGGAICIAGLFYALILISKGSWMGQGDAKLAIVLGLLAGGPLASVLLIFIASILGTLAAIPLLAQGKLRLKAHIPFGPFLLLATGIVVLWGSAILDWYSSLLTVGG